MKIAVLAAGTSTERDVSVSTSKNVCASLRRNGYQANMIDVFFGTTEYESADAFFAADNDLEKTAEKMLADTDSVEDEVAARKETKASFFGDNVLEYCEAADIVFLGLHGANGEDGKIQATFDLLNIKYTGTDYISSAVSMDKALTKKVLVSSGIPMPKGIVLNKNQEIPEFPIPCVVKPACGGSSVGVTIVKEEAQFKKALEEAFALEDTVVIEEFVSGREFSIGVFDGKAMPIVEIAAKDGVYDYKNKYDANGAVETCPADLPEDVAKVMQHWAEEACKAAGVTTLARVDELLNEKMEPFALEINTLPGMTATSLVPKEAAALGWSYDDLTKKIIEISLKKYEA